jgi:mannose-1-phosphate guanylyltransferase/mannose-6-phosphate isomerase
MSTIKVIPVILCGGSGSRLWPLSRTYYPKQFLSLSGENSGKSLFQEAFERINLVIKPGIALGPTLIVTSEEHRFLVLDQLQNVDGGKAILLLEPTSKNTAPALTIAAIFSRDDDEDPILVVTPADHAVVNSDVFIKALQDCIAVAAADPSNRTVAVLGISPDTPEVGYGYIKCNDTAGVNNDYLVEKFVEKPDINTAKQYVTNDNYFWNSGIFVLRASTWLAALQEFRSDIYEATQKAWAGRVQESLDQVVLVRPLAEDFNMIPSESVDYAVMERCSGSNQFKVKMVELKTDWSDLGVWSSVWKLGKKDAYGNVTSGDVLLNNSKNSLVYSDSRLVSAVGVNDLIIVETSDAILVANKYNSQDVKDIVSKLRDQKRDENLLHRKVTRPWGWYDSLDEGDCFKVKRIQVKPGASLSLQKHAHRAEHWIVVRGVAEITNGDQTIILTKNQSTFILQGQIHRLRNPTKDPLEIIEVQTGEYLGEDDIVRFEDSYGRT